MKNIHSFRTIRGGVLFLAALSLLACVEKDKGLSVNTDALECMTFKDHAVESFALTHWDTNGDVCLTKDEADAVTNIPARAFLGNKSLTSLEDLTMFKNLTTIDAWAFSNCDNLQEVNLDTITMIHDSAFANCDNLVRVDFPNASISGSAFNGCPRLDYCFLENAKKCENDHAYVCKDSKWGHGISCGGLGCNVDECNTISTIDCMGNAKKCENNIAYVCKDNLWSGGTDCGSLGCDGDVCRTKPVIMCSEDGYLVDISTGARTPCSGKDLCIVNSDGKASCTLTFFEELYDETCNEPNKESHYCSYRENTYSETDYPSEMYNIHRRCGADGYVHTTYGESCEFGVCTWEGGCEAYKNDPSCTCDKNSEGENRTYCKTYKAYDGNYNIVNENYVVSIPCECDGDHCDWNWDNVKKDYHSAEECQSSYKFTCPMLSATCTDNATMCKDSHAYVCENQRWKKVRDCVTTCSSDGKQCKETTPCVNGDKMCRDGKAYVCQNNSWGTGTTCENYLCDGDVCQSDNKCSDEYPGAFFRDDKCVDGNAVTCKDGIIHAENCTDQNGICSIDAKTGKASCLLIGHALSNAEICSDDDFMRTTSSCEIINGEDYYIQKTCRRPITSIYSSYITNINYNQIENVMKCHEGCDPQYGGCYDRYYTTSGLCDYQMRNCTRTECYYSESGNNYSTEIIDHCECYDHECTMTSKSNTFVGHCRMGSVDYECF